MRAVSCDQGPIAAGATGCWSDGHREAPFMDVLRKVLVLLLIGIVFLPVPAVPQQSAAPPPPPGQAPPPPPPGTAPPEQQAAGQPQEPKPFTAEELDQIVAPIALHPDNLLAQILMA